PAAPAAARGRRLQQRLLARARSGADRPDVNRPAELDPPEAALEAEGRRVRVVFARSFHPPDAGDRDHAEAVGHALRYDLLVAAAGERADAVRELDRGRPLEALARAEPHLRRAREERPHGVRVAPAGGRDECGEDLLPGLAR